MSRVIHRIIGLFAILTLVGVVAGCDRNTSDRDRYPSNEIGQTDQTNEGVLPESDELAGQQNEPTPVGERPSDRAAAGERDELGQAIGREGNQMAGDQAAEDQMAENSDRGATPSGAMTNLEALDDARDEVASDLDIPESAVILSQRERDRFSTASDDTERKGLLTVSTVRGYMPQLDAATFADDDERGAYARLQADITTLEQNLQQFPTLREDQRDDLKSRVDDNIDDVNDNFKKVSKYIDFTQTTATGGGPVDDSDSPSGVDDSSGIRGTETGTQQGDHNRDLNQNREPAGQPSDQDNMPGTQPSDQNSGGLQTY